MNTENPPHPDAAHPPSPARGEGKARRAARAGAKVGLVSVGARSRRMKSASPKSKAPPSGTTKPSPLAGEGGERRSRSPGEGDGPNSEKAAAGPREIRKQIADPKRPLRSKRKRDTARRLRKAMTDAERKLWSLLRNRTLSGCKFRRQVPIGPYVADFACFEARLIVEADGGQHAAPEHDAKRNEWLRAEGYRVLRFRNSDISDNPEGVLQKLAATLPIHQETMQ